MVVGLILDGYGPEKNAPVRPWPGLPKVYASGIPEGPPIRDEKPMTVLDCLVFVLIELVQGSVFINKEEFIWQRIDYFCRPSSLSLSKRLWVANQLSQLLQGA